MTLIRVLRDDNFLKQMLLLIRRFYLSYVVQRKLPPENMFFQRNDYQVNACRKPTAICCHFWLITLLSWNSILSILLHFDTVSKHMSASSTRQNRIIAHQGYSLWSKVSESF